MKTRRSYKGKNHPRYNKERHKKHYCIENCGNEICYDNWRIGGGRCQSCGAKERNKIPENNSNFIDGRTKVKHYCIEEGCENEICYETWRIGKKICSSCSGKNRWKKKNWRRKTLRASFLGRQTKPNKPETLLNNLLQRILPKEYEINVKGKVMVLGGKVPDFINCNGQKKVIELYGDFWHSNKWVKKRGCYEDTEKGRIKYFKKLGWDTLIIWEHELENLEKVIAKVMEFNYVKD